MSEEQKRLRLMVYWLFTAVMVVFAAVTTYIYIWVAQIKGTIWMAVQGALPITLIVAVAAGILGAVYYFLVYKKA